MTAVDANRAGRMTFGQRLRLLRGEAALLFMAGIGAGVCIALGPNLLAAFGDLGIVGGVLVAAFFLMCAVMTVAGCIGAGMVMGDALLGGVRSISGRAHVRREGVTTNALARPLPSAYTYPGQYNYKLEVGDMEFDVGADVGRRLESDGGHVRVYYARYSGELLSVEAG